MLAVYARLKAKAVMYRRLTNVQVSPCKSRSPLKRSTIVYTTSPFLGGTKWITHCFFHLAFVMLKPSETCPLLGALLTAALTGVVDLVGTALLL